MNILLVVANAAAPTTGDTSLKGILEELGHTVTLRSDESAEDVTGQDGVVIAESVSSGAIAAKYDTAAVPVVTHEAGNVDDLRLGTGTNPNVNFTALTIENDTHEVADGPHGTFTGVVTVLSAGNRMGHDTSLPTGMTSLANSLDGGGQGDATNERLAVAESGATLTSGTAPAKRAFVGFAQDAGAAVLTADGENLLKNLYSWAFGGAAAGVELAATIASSSSLAGELATGKPLTATIASSSSLAGELRAGKPLAATIASSATLEGTLPAGVELAASLASQGTLTAALRAAKPLAATIESAGGLAAQLAVGVPEAIARRLRLLLGVGQ